MTDPQPPDPGIHQTAQQAADGQQRADLVHEDHRDTQRTRVQDRQPGHPPLLRGDVGLADQPRRRGPGRPACGIKIRSARCSGMSRRVVAKWLSVQIPMPIRPAGYRSGARQRQAHTTGFRRPLVTFRLLPPFGMVAFGAGKGTPGRFRDRGERRMLAAARSIAAAGFRIGDHTITHPYLTQLSDAAVRHEILGGAQQIITVTGRNPAPLFRFPFGDADARTIAIVNRAGYVPVGGPWTLSAGKGPPGTSALRSWSQGFWPPPGPARSSSCTSDPTPTITPPSTPTRSPI